MSNQSTRSSRTQDNSYSIDDVAELLEIEVVMPEDNPHSFDEVIGNEQIVEHLSKLALLLKDDKKRKTFC